MKGLPPRGEENHASPYFFADKSCVYISQSPRARARESWRTQTFGEKALLNFQKVAQSHLRAAAGNTRGAAALGGIKRIL